MLQIIVFYFAEIGIETSDKFYIVLSFVGLLIDKQLTCMIYKK